MSRRILVSTNCITPLLASALRAIFPTDPIEEAHQLTGTEDATLVDEFAARLGAANLWIRHGEVRELAAHPAIARLLPRITTLDIPHLRFSAFHPDLFYAFRAPGVLIHPHYNSGIVIWAYRNRLDPADARRLFHKNTFAALGYFARWESSVELLQRRFEHYRLDFGRFFLKVKRTGVFMHAVNHPTAATVVAFAKSIAIALGATERVWDQAIEITDRLADVYRWPVYPEIGHHYSLPGSYDWTIDGRHYGLDGFIERSYGSYRAAGIAPENMELHAPPEARAALDQVLTSAMKGGLP